MIKQELRKKYGLIRKSIERRDEKDDDIAKKLGVIIAAYPSAFCYVSFGSEVDTRRIINDNKEKIFIPYTYDGVMHCRKYLGGSLVADKLGNVDPSCYGDESVPDLTVVPMLAFNSACYRLGYGGGYYDRYLSANSTLKIGLAYDEQFTNELFNELFDVPLDMIITPTKLYTR